MTTVEYVVDTIARATQCQPRPLGRNIRVRCPAHDDEHMSLDVAEGADGRALLKCRSAGCSTREIVAAVGLTLGDLFPGRRHPPVVPIQVRRPITSRANLMLPSEKWLSQGRDRLLSNQAQLARLERLRGWTPLALRLLEVGLSADGRVIFPYRDENGDLAGYARYEPDPRRRPSPDAKLFAAKGLSRGLFPAPEKHGFGVPLYIVEGEPDAVRLWSLGLQAVAIPGTGGWRTTWAKRFVGVRVVVVVFDCDAAGRATAKRVAHDLNVAYVPARVLDLDPGRDDGYDVSDALAGVPAAATPDEAGRALYMTGALDDGE